MLLVALAYLYGVFLMRSDVLLIRPCLVKLRIHGIHNVFKKVSHETQLATFLLTILNNLFCDFWKFILSSKYKMSSHVADLKKNHRKNFVQNG